MRVEIAHRTVHLGRHHETVDLERLTLQALRDNRQLLADRSRRSRLAVGVRKHRHLRPLLGHGGDFARHFVHRLAENRLAVAEHERMRHVVYIFGSASEVDEFSAFFKRGAGDLLLEEVFNRLDVVIGGFLKMVFCEEGLKPL